MTRRTSTLWTFAITSLALFMVTLDNLVVTTALPVDPQRPRRIAVEQLEWTVNAYTLTFAVLLLTGAALGDRFGRRRHVRDRASAIFTARLGRRRARAVDRRADRRPRDPGRRRRDRDAADADDPLARRSRRSGAASRSARGAASAASPSRFGPLVGGAVVEGISWQWIFWLNVPIGLVLVPLALLAAATRATGPDGRLDLPGLGLVERRPVRHRLGPRARQRAGLGEPRDRRRARRRGVVLLAAFVAWELRARAPMLPMRFFRNRAFALANVVVAADVLRDVRLDLPARAVLPDRAGLLAARRRAADPAVDGDADDRRADRRRAVGPDRRPRRIIGTGLALQAIGARLDRGGLDADGRRTSTLVVPFVARRRRHGALLRAGRERRALGGAAARRRARPRAPTTRSASSAASSASPCWPRSSRTRAATATRRHVRRRHDAGGLRRRGGRRRRRGRGVPDAAPDEAADRRSCLVRGCS